jgi:tetratricopeptide (TPR) repeat protein
MAEGYLRHALTLFPENAEIRLLAGIGREMRASPRTSGLSSGDRRDALKAAEGHYRFVVTKQPDRLEARLRLGRVLQQRNELTEARALLTPLVTVADDRIAYLAQLFLGGIEDATRHPDAALAAYDRAAVRVPFAQTARLAASELRHRRGDRQAAADAVPAAAGAMNTFDPWWVYIFGEFWRADLLLDALRKLRRA